MTSSPHGGFTLCRGTLAEPPLGHALIYGKYRDDGWPLCPGCGEDELWSNATPATIDTIAGCYRCSWTPRGQRWIWGPDERHHHPLEQLRELAEMVKALPPVPERIIGRLDVPRGRTFRMWDTRGRLVVYANRSDLERLPRAERPFEVVGISTLAPPHALGIPVVYETAPLPTPHQPRWRRLARRLARQEDR